MLPPEIDSFRDHAWQRELTQRVETVEEAERFVGRVGFSALLTDRRQPGPSLYIAVCGRRDAQVPQNVQKDPESSLTWVLKDEVIKRGCVYYGKLARGKSTFLAPRLIPYFKAIWGVARREEKRRLSAPAFAVLKVLRKEWEMATSDLRADSGVTDRKEFARAIDELQATMIVVPGEVVYVPKFTYIWTLAEGRFPEQLAEKVDRETARQEIARAFLTGAGMTLPGEMAKVTGMDRKEAGLANRALVEEGFAVSPSRGVYHLADLTERLQQLHVASDL